MSGLAVVVGGGGQQVVSAAIPHRQPCCVASRHGGQDSLARGPEQRLAVTGSL